jgi:hypothetical protein
MPYVVTFIPRIYKKNPLSRNFFYCKIMHKINNSQLWIIFYEF